MINLRDKNDDVYEKVLSLGHSKLISHLVAQRCDNVNDVEKIFNNDDKNIIPDLNELMGSNEAAELIYSHIVKGSLIVVITDYDADGVSSGGFSKRAFLEYFDVPKENLIVITNERRYGNGVNDDMVNKVLDIHDRRNVGLVITTDHGSADDERFKILKDKSMDVIVTDHHLLPSTGVPINVNVFVNPQQPGDAFSNNISGCTVIYFVLLQVYNLFIERGRDVPKEDNLDSILPIVTNTILTDQMSLKDPINRYLLKRGLDILNMREDIPWTAAHILLDLPKKITEDNIGFGLGPLFNAAGRMGKAYLATDFLGCSDLELAVKKLKGLIDLNLERKQLQDRLLLIGKEQASNYVKVHHNTIVIVLQDGHGVGGIIAGMVGEKYNLPIFVFSDEGDGILVGSGRSIVDNINIVEAMNYVKKHGDNVMIRGGGHAAAGGCSIHKDKMVDFFGLFDDAILEQMSKLGDMKKIHADIDIPSKYITCQLVNEIDKISPFGNSWHKPILYSKVKISKYFKVGVGKNHLVLKISPGDGYADIDGFYPHFDSKVMRYFDDEYVNITYTLSCEKNKVRILIKDIIPM